jgi:hypothetical protein
MPSHLGRIGLDLMPAILAPHGQPDAAGGSIAERHRRAGFGFHVAAVFWLAVAHTPSAAARAVIRSAVWAADCVSDTGAGGETTAVSRIASPRQWYLARMVPTT